jgi:hypothetical protein
MMHSSLALSATLFLAARVAWSRLMAAPGRLLRPSPDASFSAHRRE